jgi:hypothetical protein
MTKTAFTQADVTRAVRGAMVAGIQVGAVEVRRDGTILILPKDQDTPQTPRPKTTPKDWD